MTWYVHQQRLATHPPHIFLQPDVAGYGSLDFKNIDGPSQAGVAEAGRCLSEPKALKEFPFV